MNEAQNTSVEETAIVELDLTFKPEIFDPNKEQLRAIAAEVAKIEADPTKMTKDTLELINTTKNKLVKARTRIQKIGKAQRDPANKFAKEVKAYEDSLLAILAPEEERMKVLERTAKEHAMREERMKTLPEFIEKLKSIGDRVAEEFEGDYQEFLLSLDPNQRDAYYNERLAAKNEADKAAIEEQKRQQEAAAQAERDKLLNTRREIMIEIGFATGGEMLHLDGIETQTTYGNDSILEMSESEFASKSEEWRKIAESKKAHDIKEAEERAKAQAEEEAKQKAAAEEEARRVAEEAENKAKEEAARKAQEEEQARRSTESYQKWLSDSSYNESTDIIQENEGVYTLYRKVSTYTPQAFGFAPKNDV